MRSSEAAPLSSSEDMALTVLRQAGTSDVARSSDGIGCMLQRAARPKAAIGAQA